MMGKTIMETISGRFNFMRYDGIPLFLKMAPVNRNFTGRFYGRINRQLDDAPFLVTVRSRQLGLPVTFRLLFFP